MRVVGPVLALALLSCGDSGERSPMAPGPPPIVQSVSPSTIVPGRIVTITGENFGIQPTELSVTFNGLPGEVVSVTPFVAVALVPLELQPGAVVLRVSLRGVNSAATVTLNALPPGPPFTAVSAGRNHTCGVLLAAGAHCWGLGVGGQLGSGTPVNHSPHPIPVIGGATFVAVTAGSRHTCALDPAGAAFCWGRNDHGQLGNGTTLETAAPVPVADALSFVSLSAGKDHTCGVSGGGGGFCWGRNEFGQLGDGTSTDQPRPVAVAGGLAWASISAGGTHTCGVTREGQAYCWGANVQGELGDGTREERIVPAPVAGELTFVSISVGRAPVTTSEVGEHTCGVTLTGQAYCWGTNHEGQLGTGNQLASSTPTLVQGGQSFAALSTGAFHTCGVTTLREALCWGANDSGQLGNGMERALSPLPALFPPRFAAISAGTASKSVLEPVSSHTCALTEDGIAVCWGQNASGQLGSGGVSTQSTPVPVSPPGSVSEAPPDGPGDEEP